MNEFWSLKRWMRIRRRLREMPNRSDRKLAMREFRLSVGWAKQRGLCLSEACNLRLADRQRLRAAGKLYPL